MAVVCRHFENGDKIFATAGAPLTEPRRGDFLCTISKMASCQALPFCEWRFLALERVAIFPVATKCSHLRAVVHI